MELTSVAQLADRYDAFLLDQFGVLHDGTNAIPGAVDCFAQLVAKNKKCVILSNTSRRGGAGAVKLKKMGFAADALSGFVASGELAYQFMASELRGKKALWFGWVGGDHASYVDGLDLTFAPAETADFVLCQGTQSLDDGSGTPLRVNLHESGVLDDAVGAVLDACVARGLKMICCNPDYIALVSFGTGHMPGALARAYEERGGTVISFGKPSTAAFEAGLALLGGGIPKERVCHVGDSLHHDIAGANASGVDCLWVAATGIHADELGLAADATALPSDAYDRVVGAWGGKPPTHVTMRFRWEG